MVLPTASIGQIQFQESAADFGVNYSYGFSDLGGGVSFVDFNSDGWDDISFTTEEGEDLLFFVNRQGDFTLIDLGIKNTEATKQILWVDYDNDGDKDLFVTSLNGPNKFYLNDGKMSFTDITETTGLFTSNLFSTGAAFGDIDNDGDLDLFIANRDIITKSQRNYLYLNDEGTFVDITQSAGLSEENDLTFCAVFFDYNGDGYQDIYVVNDRYTKSNKLYKNNGDLSFDDVSIDSKTGISIDAMSGTVGDFNSDGWFDLYVTNTQEGNYHFKNNGDGTFTNLASVLGTSFESFAWGAVFLDADLDADLDLYVSGMLKGTDSRLPSAFYENSQGIFSIPESAGFENDKRISFSNAIGDIDNDGSPDIIVMNHAEDNFLWHNNSENNNNWLKVRLEGVQSNADGIGSVIEVSSESKSQYRYTLCGEGYLGQNSNTEFFGLAQSDHIDFIKVRWLSGVEDIITDVRVNQMVTIREGEGVITNVSPLKTNSLIIYPNPSSDGKLKVKANYILGGQLQILNNLGRLVDKQVINGEEVNLDMSLYPRGVYFVKFTQNYKTEVIKIILQ